MSLAELIALIIVFASLVAFVATQWQMIHWTDEEWSEW